MAVRQNDPETLREEVVNTLLAELLQDHHLKARAERRSKRGAPDVRVELRGGDFALLECKWEGAANALASQLEERLKDYPKALGVVGVLYPERLRRAENTSVELTSAADLQWWVHGSRGETLPERRMRSGTVEDLAGHIRALPLELEGPDRVAAAAAVVGYALERAAGEISRHARLSQRIADLIAQTDQEKNRAAALRIGCLVLFNAIAFQERLAVARPDVPTVREANAAGVEGLRDAWRLICDTIDYVPVFELAADILDVLVEGPNDVRAPVITALTSAMADTRHLEGHDLSGRLFHTLLSDAKFTGAYYTSVPAATLLARLVFEGWPRGIEWSQHEFAGSLNVADLACGTGTLLVAVASEVERRHREAGGRNARELHKAVVEQAIHGYDVQLSAVHFAATSLAMLNPDIQFDNMNLYVMALGVDGEKTSLGSLDFLGVEEVAVQYALSPDITNGGGALSAERVSGSGARGVAEGVTARLPDLDLAIMNPPFTRSSLMFGSLPTAERRRIQSELTSRLESRRASGVAGMGGAFVAAAAPKLRPGEGRLALVLPLTVCTGRSWAPTRSLVEDDFSLDLVITSHDPARWNFSDSTDLSEALLIATRRPSDHGADEPRTTFVNLWRNPDGILDAHRMAQAVADATPARVEDAGTALLSIDGQHAGEIVSIPESRIRGRKWIGVQFARADLTRSALRLLDGSEVWAPGEASGAPVSLCRFRDIGSAGPDRRDILDGFERTDTVTAYPMVEGHDTERRRWLAAEPDAYLAPLAQPRPGRRLKRLDHLWPKAARLLVAERLRLDTARVVAMWSEREVLSNVWWEVGVEDVRQEKALVLWLNSSLGLLTVLAQRTTTEGGWVAMKKADLEELPVLDTRALSDEQLEDLASLFDELAEAEFARLPDMADCYARSRLDEGLSRILGLPNLQTLRQLLATEPVVSNRRL